MKIAISIGHGKSKSGGYDSGAVGGGYHEFKIAREIGKYAADALNIRGTRADLINYGASKYLTDRIAYINKNGYDLALEIHLNAGGGTGSEVYYKHTNKQGQTLAKAISSGIATALSLRDRGVKVKLNSSGADYFGFVRDVKCQSLLIETVFIDTKSDRDKVTTADGVRKCGEAIANAVASVYGLKAPVSKPTDTPTPTTSIGVGDTVKITGKYYATGQTIPLWVRLKQYTVKSVDTKLGRALLKEINSYVWLSDLKVTKKAAVQKAVAVGSVVTIKKGAVYGGLTSARGKAIPSAQLSPKKHTVSKLQSNKGVNEALLSDISSWVAVSSLEVV